MVITCAYVIILRYHVIRNTLAICKPPSRDCHSLDRSLVIIRSLFTDFGNATFGLFYFGYYVLLFRILVNTHSSRTLILLILNVVVQPYERGMFGFSIRAHIPEFIVVVIRDKLCPDTTPVFILILPVTCFKLLFAIPLLPPFTRNSIFLIEGKPDD